MEFWGIQVKPGKPYVLHSDDFHGQLHITQATAGLGSSTEKTVLQCSIGDKSPIFLCSLLPDRIENCPLNLKLEHNGAVSFSVIGPRSIHLSGFQEVDCRNSYEDDYDTDSFGEDIADTETDESSDYDTEDECEDDFIDDDLEMYPPSPVPNSGVVIEEILEDEKPETENTQPKRLKEKSQLTQSDLNDNSQRKIVAKSDSLFPVLESEDEDGFPVSASNKGKLIVHKPQTEAEEMIDQKTSKKSMKKRRRDGEDKAENLTGRVDTVISDEQPERGNNESEVPENDLKQKKKKKKQKQSKMENGQEADSDVKSNILPVTDEQNQKPSDDNNLESEVDHISDGNQSVEKKKKKKKKKSNAQESKGDGDKQQIVGSVKGINGSSSVEKKPEPKKKKTEPKPSHARTFSNGMVIEELAMGKPDGKRAAPGKRVSVHYTGKLQKNGSIFDSNVGRAPFKFRLGVGQVIKGWDVGVNGMRVGDKRRLTIPPSMGYGPQGAGKKIPPNAWLVFDVELVDVN